MLGQNATIEHERTTLGQELRIIPKWAMVLAVAIFVGGQVLMQVLFKRESNPPPLALQGLLGLLVSSILAFIALMVGYVNRDARRRGMNAALWTALVIFVGNGIGFIIYFLLRQPLRMECLRCAAKIDATFNYCPKCNYNFRPTCPQCKRSVRPGDTYCPYCGLVLPA